MNGGAKLQSRSLQNAENKSDATSLKKWFDGAGAGWRDIRLLRRSRAGWLEEFTSTKSTHGLSDADANSILPLLPRRT